MTEAMRTCDLRELHCRPSDKVNAGAKPTNLSEYYLILDLIFNFFRRNSAKLKTAIISNNKAEPILIQ